MGPQNSPQIERRSRLFKLLRRVLAGSAGLRSKHGASLALDILEANGVEEIAIKRPNGRCLHISTRDKVIASEVVRLGTFARENMDAFVALLSAHGMDPATLTFVNVGANIGTTCLNAYDIGFRRFVAIEPEPRNFDLLQKNLAGLSGASTRYHQAAIGEAPGTAILHRHRTNLGSHSLLPSAASQAGSDSIQVPVQTLATLIEPGDRFVLFVDVEGFEPQVLRGSAAAIESGCAALALEITPGRYATKDAIDLQKRISAFSGTFILLPSGQQHDTSVLQQLMVSQREGHFDIAVVLSQPS